MPAELVIDEQGRFFVDSVYAPYPKQDELHVSTARNLLAIGGWGSGKSTFLIGEALYVACEYPGADVLLLRRNWKELEKGLILDWHNIVPPELFRYQKQEHVATLFNGSHVFFGHLQNGTERDLAQFLSSAFVFIGIDEVGQFSYQAYTFMFGRARINRGCQQNAQGYWPACRVGSATNPMGPGYGWIKDLWILKKPPSQIENAKKGEDGKYFNERGSCVYDPKDYHYTHSTILDNPAQMQKDPDYINKLQALPPALRAKALEGDLHSVAGSYFGNFSWDRNVRSLPADRARLIFEDWQPCWMSMDWGLAHYCAIYWHTMAKAQDMDGKWKTVCVTYRELMLHDKSLTEIRNAIDAATPRPPNPGETDDHFLKNERSRLKFMFLSPERFHRNEYKHVVANELSDLMREKHLPLCHEAADARIDGAVFLYGLIESGDWIILDNCATLVRSIETRIRDEKRLEDVLKTDDDLDDAYDGARYGVFSMLRERGKPEEVKFQERLERIENPVARTALLYQKYLEEQSGGQNKKMKIVPRWQRQR